MGDYCPLISSVPRDRGGHPSPLTWMRYCSVNLIKDLKFPSSYFVIIFYLKL